MAIHWNIEDPLVLDIEAMHRSAVDDERAHENARSLPPLSSPLRTWSPGPVSGVTEHFSLQNSVDYEEESPKKSIFAAKHRPSTDDEDESSKQSVFASKSRPSLEHEDESPKKSVFSAKIPTGHVELTLADFPPHGASKPRKKGTNSKLKDHTEQESCPFSTNANPQHEDPGK
ncbi:hypothetical protein K438DRAFT_1785866 [Mycena galopus ATCC 62051]|nr:hypothetical protein K438DRAFT_1785866 [Mycena galopus ATCC 62051]